MRSLLLPVVAAVFVTSAAARHVHRTADLGEAARTVSDDVGTPLRNIYAGTGNVFIGPPSRDCPRDLVPVTVTDHAGRVLAGCLDFSAPQQTLCFGTDVCRALSLPQCARDPLDNMPLMDGKCVP